MLVGGRSAHTQHTPSYNTLKRVIRYHSLEGDFHGILLTNQIAITLLWWVTLTKSVIESWKVHSSANNNVTMASCWAAYSLGSFSCRLEYGRSRESIWLSYPSITRFNTGHTLEACTCSLGTGTCWCSCLNPEPQQHPTTWNTAMLDSQHRHHLTTSSACHESSDIIDMVTSTDLQHTMPTTAILGHVL